MKIFLFIFYLFFISCVFGNVLELTPENFDSVVDGSKHVFVEFFAPWCGHCKNLAPEYEIVGESFARENNVIIAKVDADAHKDLGSRFEVHGFPTLKFFPKGSKTPKNYEGGRTAEDIINYINGETGTKVRVKKAPSNVVDLDPSNFDKIVMDKNKDVLVEFFAPWCGHCKKLAPDYEKVANAFVNEPNVVIAKIDADKHKDLASKYGVSGFPTIKFFSKSNKEPISYDQSREVEAFVNFINEKAGTERMVDGKLKETAGRIESLDAIADKVAKGENVNNLIKEAETIVKGLPKDKQTSGKYYLKVLESVKSKGKDFVSNEISRLNRMLEGSVSPNKVDEFTIRKNILKSFQ
jgi:protein disulfide-isomerase A6